MTQPTHPSLVHSLARTLCGAPALFAVLALPLAAPPAFAQAEAATEPGLTAEELIEKNLEAKGGRETIDSVEAARIQGTMTMPGPSGTTSAPFTMEWRAPNQARFELTLQGMTMVQAFDGESGWMINPFMGKIAPEKMSAEDAEMFKDQAEFHGPLVDWEEKGYTVEYLGEEEVEGTPAHKLMVTKPSGEEIVLFLDQEYFLEIHSDVARTVRGETVESSVAIGDYKEVDGLILAHSLDIQGGGGPGGTMTMTFETVELNPELPDDRFTMPEVEETEGDGSDGSSGPAGSAR